MDRYQSARQEILQWLADTLKVSADQIDLNKPLPEVGLDSLDAVHMVATIESIIRMELPEDIMRRVKCLGDIFDMMRERMAAA